MPSKKKKSKPSAPEALFLGRLQRDFVITAQQQALIDQPGGNLLYAASAFKLWGDQAGLVARVGSDFPAKWIKQFDELGFDTRGIRSVAALADQRRFIAYPDTFTARQEQPIKHFGRLGLPFPKSLLGYKPPSPHTDSKRERGLLSLRPEDIPADYLSAKAAHLCPLDYFSHHLLPATLRSAGIQTVTLDAGANYMHPRYWNEVPELVNGLTVFLADEQKMRNLFASKTTDLWEMAAGIAKFNCHAVVIKSLTFGQYLYDEASAKRYHIPAYPARIADITSAGSSFCGGFLAGLMRKQDLLEATLIGSATASLAMEGSGAFYISDSLTGLVDARVESLRQAVKIV
jgi:sugar/nucleoside kinase (ribokinase family)